MLRISSWPRFRSARSKSSTQLLRAVVLDPLRVAFVILVDAVALLPDGDGIAEGGGRKRIVGVLLEHDAVRADRQRALGDDHVSREGAAARLQVGVAGVAGEGDRLVAVGLAPRGRGGRRDRGAQGRTPLPRRASGAQRGKAVSAWRISLRQQVGLERSAHGGFELDRARVVVEDHPDALDYSTRLLDRHEQVGFGPPLLWDDAQRFGGEGRRPDRVLVARGRRARRRASPGPDRASVTISRSPDTVPPSAVTAIRGLPGSVSSSDGAMSSTLPSSGKCSARVAASICRTRPSTSKLTALNRSM